MVRTQFDENTVCDVEKLPLTKFPRQGDMIHLFLRLPWTLKLVWTDMITELVFHFRQDLQHNRQRRHHLPEKYDCNIFGQVKQTRLKSMHHLLKSNVLPNSKMICIFLMTFLVLCVVALISIRSWNNLHSSLHLSSNSSIYLLPGKFIGKIAT